MVKDPVVCPACSRILSAASGCAASGCPSAKGCELLRCPGCGIEFRPPAPWVRRFQDWLRRRRRPHDADAA